MRFYQFREMSVIKKLTFDFLRGELLGQGLTITLFFKV